jgi:thymidylate kinase
MRRRFIVLMGIDGSGKSTQAEALRDWLVGEGFAAETVWMRGESYVTRPVLAVGKAVLRAPAESKRGGGAGAGKAYADYVGAKRSFFKSRMLRKVWTGLTVLDLYITFRSALLTVPRKTEFVILDRYIYDSFIDIDTAFGEKGVEALGLLRSRAASIFPRPELVLFLEITPEEAMRRKDDIPSIQYLEEREPIYRAIAEALGAVPVDGNGPREQVQTAIREIVKRGML